MPGAPQSAETALIGRVLLDDDRRAFDQLVRLNQSATRAFLRRLTPGDAALSDDLAQETFLRAYTHLGTFKAQSRFQTWLFSIAWRLFLSHIRRVRPVDNAESADVPVPAASEQVHLHHDMERALHTLSDDERAVISLCYDHDLSHDEAARVLAMPLGTVKTHALRGKEKLRKRLAAWQPEQRL